MSSCYPSLNLSFSRELTEPGSIKVIQCQQQQEYKKSFELKELQGNPVRKVQLCSHNFITAGTGTSTSVLATTAILSATSKNKNTPKDYFVPLHVDCSVEYELPKQPKPPAGQRVEPLLMIHPCYFRKIESQRRSPFINNMPNSSKNGAPKYLGVTLVSQGSYITPLSDSITSSKRNSFGINEHNRTRQHLPSKNGSFVHNEHHQPLQTEQQNFMNTWSLMSKQTPYTEISSPCSNANFLEKASSPIQQTTTSNLNQSHHILCSTLQGKNQSHLKQVQSSSSCSKSPSSNLAAVARIVTSSISKPNLNKFPAAAIKVVCDAEKSSIAKSSTLRIGDATITGSGDGHSTYSSSTNKYTSMQMERNVIGKNIKKISSGKQNTVTTIPKTKSYEFSTRLVDRTKCYWNPTSSFIIDRIPIATVPSNLQAGPNSTPDTPGIYTGNGYKNNELRNCGKYMQCLGPYRVHPYLSKAPSHFASLPPPSEGTHSSDDQVLTMFSEAEAAVAATTALMSFQQVQNISCYNV